MTAPLDRIREAINCRNSLRLKEAIALQGGNLDSLLSNPATTYLRQASSVNWVEGMGILIAAGATVDLVDEIGNTLLMDEAYSEKTNSIALLLELGADVHAMNNSGHTALTLAAMNESLGAFKLLLAKGANPDHKSKRPLDCTPMMYACCDRSHVKEHAAISLLLAAGADINTQDSTGKTALMHAASEANFKAVKALISAGADVLLPMVDGKTALDLAKKGSYLHPAQDAERIQVTHLLQAQITQREIQSAMLPAGPSREEIPKAKRKPDLL